MEELIEQIQNIFREMDDRLLIASNKDVVRFNVLNEIRKLVDEYL